MAVRGQDRADPTATLFSSSRRLAIAEHLGIPTEVVGGPAGAGLGRLRACGGAELLWASADDAAGATGLCPGAERCL